MGSVKRALIVGGGIGGMCSAIQLSKIGVEVDLIDLDPDWRVYGAGITITGPTYRAFRDMGLMNEVADGGFACRGVRLRTQSGVLIKEMFGGGLEADIPFSGGILRPRLHQILAQHVRESGAHVSLGRTVDAIVEQPQAVKVTFSDGEAGDYDLVVGADGINSKVRSLIFADPPVPRYTGQGAWRVLAKRPRDLDCVETYLGDTVKAGVTPVSDELFYMFALSPEEGEAIIAPDDQPARLKEVLAGFGGLIGEVRDSLGPENSIVYRPLQVLLMPRPWYRGRTVILGDAAHATTPQLASGAGSAVEDAVVLAQEVARAEHVEDALAAFCERRFERCRDVVESSIRLGEIELSGGSSEEHSRVYTEATMRLALPI